MTDENPDDTEGQAHRKIPEPPMPEEYNTYRARPDIFSKYPFGVVDGDTYEMFVYQGFETYSRVKVRPYHLDTGEVFGVRKGSEEYERGLLHREFIVDWMREKMGSTMTPYENDTWPLRIRTYHTPAGWGRWMADVYHESGESLSKALYEEFGDEVLSKKFPTS